MDFFVPINLLEFVLGCYLETIWSSWVLLSWFVWYTCSSLGWIIPHYWAKPSWVLKPSTQELWFLSVWLGKYAIFPALSECWTLFSNLFRLFFPWPLCFFTWIHWSVPSWISEGDPLQIFGVLPLYGSSSLLLCPVDSSPLGTPNSQLHLFHSDFCSLHHSLEALSRHQAGMIIGLPHLFLASQGSLSFVVKYLENCCFLKKYFVCFFSFV